MLHLLTNTKRYEIVFNDPPFVVIPTTTPSLTCQLVKPFEHSLKYNKYLESNGRGK